MSLKAHSGETDPGPQGGRRGAGQGRLLGVLASLLLASPGLGLSSAQTIAAPPPSGPVWLDPTGTPLPFQDDDEVREFLRTASVIERTRTDEGINRPDRLLLEGGGVRVHAVFREVNTEKRRTRVQGRFYLRFLDNYAADCAAYDLARSLGMDNVPPTVVRQIGSSEGSLQIWVENTRDVAATDFRPSSPLGWMKQQWDMSLFDNLILNVDRNVGNLLVGQGEELWLIDHGRAFQPQAELLAPEKLKKINRRIWDRLGALDDEELKDLVREHLDPEQLQSLVQRRELLVELVQRLVDEYGEARVFY